VNNLRTEDLSILSTENLTDLVPKHRYSQFPLIDEALLAQKLKEHGFSSVL
jgi:hypothetical protein